jgi:NADH-quinone oxidoreductase subunit J
MITVAGNGITTTRDGMRGAQVGASAGPGECRPSAPARCHDPYHAFSFSPEEVNAAAAGNVQTTGIQLFTTFLLPFEITSLLLLTAAIGAVYLTRRPVTDTRPARRRGRRSTELPAAGVTAPVERG